MRFLSAWYGVIKENTSLRIAIFILGLCVAAESAVLVFNSSKPPLVIDRACFSKILKPTNTQVTENEVKIFVALALEKRFNSTAGETDAFLSLKERELRKLEQEELKGRNMRQTLIVNEIKIDNDKIIIDSDRLISVGDIRSTFQFHLTVKVELTERTETNPYGLILTDVHGPDSDKKASQK